MANVLEALFGTNGYAMEAFGGQWWLVLGFVMLLFLIILLQRGVNLEGMVFFVFSSLLIVMMEGLFDVPQEMFIGIIVLLLIVIGLFFYFAINK